MASICLLLTGICIGADPFEDPGIRVEIVGAFATFTNARHPGNRIGYRFHEHTPLIFGETPQSGEEATQASAAAEEAVARIEQRPGVKVFEKHVDEEGWIPETWTFYLAPAPDGIDLLLLVATDDTGLPEIYAVQQCFRLSGATNAEWRQKYALTPAFSEYDCWAQTPEAQKPSLTWVLRQGALQQLPVSEDAVGCRTPYGVTIDTERSGGRFDPQAQVGPYHARMLEPSDCGLILRTSQDRQWSCGVYWERTTHVTVHHPADCLHAIVDIGGIPAHSKRAFRGKIYWLNGSGEELVKHWRADFGD